MTNWLPEAPTLYLATGFALVAIGLAGVVARRNMLKMVLGFALMDTGIHVVIASLGCRPGGAAPILDDPSLLSDAATKAGDVALVVDPVPQALVLTAIVIGLGVTALMLSYVIRLYGRRRSLDIRDFGRLKW